LEASERDKLLIVLAGPTAVGKTDCSFKLAETFDAEIFSADSRQIYKELNIGTAKASADELRKIKHHFINHCSIYDPYDVGEYEADVITHLSNYYKSKKTAILTGGTGFYIKAVVDGLDQFPKVSDKTINKVKKKFEDEGLSYLQSYLQDRDPHYYELVDLNNPHRLLRAVSVIEETKQKFSSFLSGEKKQRDFKTVFILLDRNREELYQRINDRVDKMIEDGLIEEARGYFSIKELKSLQTVGYRELFKYFEGELSLEEAIELIKRNTRRYAKRQLTWFRRDHRWNRFHPDDHESIIKFIQSKA